MVALALVLALPVAAGCGDDTNDGGFGGGEGGSGGSGGGEGGIGGGGGDGGSGGVSPESFDTCESPGSIAVGQDEQVFVQGTMEGLADDYETFCADSPSQQQLSYPDAVYSLSLAETCIATITLEGQAGFDGIVGLRTLSCTEDEYCVNASPNGAESLKVHLDAGSYTVMVSDAGEGTADFTLGVQCQTPACADGIVSPGEECDDGNAEAGDGCAPDCLFEPSDPDLDTCAGASNSAGTAIAIGELLRIPGQAPEASTVGATNSGESTCQTGATTGPAPDHTYKIIPQANGTLIATVGLDFNGEPYCGAGEPTEDPLPPGCWDRAVHIREATCDDEAAEVACADDPDLYWLTEGASAEVVAGTEYFVFVDGYNADEYGQGIYVLQLELQ